MVMSVGNFRKQGNRILVCKDLGVVGVMPITDEPTVLYADLLGNN